MFLEELDDGLYDADTQLCRNLMDIFKVDTDLGSRKVLVDTLKLLVNSCCRIKQRVEKHLENSVTAAGHVS